MPEQQAVDGRTLIAAMLRHHRPLWTSASVESALRLVELGYGDKSPDRQETPGWLARLAQLVDDDQAARLLAVLPNLPGPNSLLAFLLQRNLGAATFPPIRDFVQKARGAAAPDWMPERDKPGEALTRFLSLAAKSRHPEAAAWLFAQLDRAQPMANLVANVLRSMSSNGDESAREPLRKLLVWPGNQHGKLTAEDRSQVLAELVRAGDVATIDLLPRAYELGLQTTYMRGDDGSPLVQVRAAGIGFLLDPASEQPATNFARWHGYADKDLERAWRVLLTSPSSSELAWLELSASSGMQTHASATVSIGQPNLQGAPAVVVPLLLELLPAWWAKQSTASKANSGIAWHVLYWIQRILHRLPDTEFREPGAIELALRRVVRGDDATLARFLCASVPKQLRAKFVDEARNLLAANPEPWFITYVCENVPLREGDWRRLLQSAEADIRSIALRSVPPESASGLRELVLACLRAEQVPVRKEAVLAAARLFGGDAVPSLLPLLQDLDRDVRQDAREQLEQLRQDAEQRTFWQKAQAGIDTSSQGAAAKLLLQAKTGEPKEQRLLALRSLAVLGVAETLPYLIDAANEADADIAAAARAAITAIHQKGGAPAERPAAEPKQSK